MNKLRKSLFRLLLILPMLGIAMAANGQSDPTGKSEATRTYAITNATIVQAPGKIMEEGTIVIKDGLITAIGKNVSIPSNAEVIDGTDMYLYPGFIDGMSNTAADRPEAMERPDNLFTPDPPNDYAGITPEHHVAGQIDVEENSIDGMRKVGFAISHTVPYGRMLPGSGALLLLRDVDHADDMILSEDVSMFTQFSGAPGAYPGNTLGIMAKFRTLYRNAEYSKKHADMYAENPAGISRPTRDRVSEAFYPVVTNQKPIFYDASSSLEARRAMRLQKELGFSLVLGNLQEGWDLADEIKASGTKVFMSLDLPKKPKASKEDDKSEEMAKLEERRMEFYKKYVSQYSELKNAGVKFGFSTIDTRGNQVKDNLMTIIENGLSEDDALAALTTNPADLLGISEMVGTLDQGKIGNVIVSTGPYFEKDSQLKYVFVDGDKHEYEIKDNKKKSGDTENSESTSEGSSSIVGTWSYSFTTPQGEQTGSMIIKKDGDFYTGTLTSDDGTPDNDMVNISFVNDALDFEFSVDAGGQSIDVVVNGTVTGNEYEAEATVTAFNISFPLLATKEAPEK
ncbi:MAG: amidohydrolase family protein [Balneola sp.]